MAESLQPVPAATQTAQQNLRMRFIVASLMRDTLRNWRRRSQAFWRVRPKNAELVHATRLEHRECMGTASPRCFVSLLIVVAVSCGDEPPVDDSGRPPTFGDMCMLGGLDTCED